MKSAALALVALLGACSNASFLDVTVESGQILTLTALDVTVENSGQTATVHVTHGASFAIPPARNFSLEIDDGRSGEVRLTVRAIGASGEVASATVTTSIVVGDQQGVTITLMPGVVDLGAGDFAAHDAALDETVPDLSVADGAMPDLADAAAPDLSPVVDLTAPVDMTVSPDLAGLVTLVTGYPVAGGIAVDGTSVYWSEHGAGLMKVPIGGGTPQGVLNITSDNYSGVTLEGATLFFTTGGDTILKIAVTGGSAVQVAQPGIGLQAFALDDSNVYWVRSISGVGGVYMAPLAGGATTTLDPSGAKVCRDAITVDTATVYWAEDGCGGCAGTGAGRIVKVAKSGGAATALATAQQHPSALTIDAANAYWTNACDGTVMKVPLGGGNVTTVASGQQQPGGIAVDTTNLYWTNAGGTVMKVALAGGAPVTLASGQSGAGAMALDATSVYWLDTTAVMKLTPK